jgi:NADH-ubiquinone oxidoreductase chain 1
LLERKVLRFSQIRVGPSKVSYIGILQPVSDALKLITNQYFILLIRNIILFFISPVLRLILSIWIWRLVPVKENFQNYTFSFVLILILLRFSVYPIIISGWSSNRNYSLIGRLRGIAQTISYEINLALILFMFILWIKRVNLLILKISIRISILILFPRLIFLWIITCLSETNRTPFDFSERERELVSGFNIEFRSIGFTLIFLSEYVRIYFFSIIRCMILFNITIRTITGQIIIFIIIFIWIWTRSTLPRFRYDLLINLAWKKILPLIIRIIQLSLVLNLIMF